MKLDIRPAGANFLTGGGELGDLIAAFDWSSTSLGPIENWSATLKANVGLLLRSPVPIVTLWGPDGIMIYNNAYSVFAGGRHPRLLGSKVRQGWPEVADFNDNVMKVGLAGGTLAYRDQQLTLFRNGVAEQVWMNLDYSPIPDENGNVVGVMAIVVETSAKVRAERWLADERDRMRQMFEQAPGFMAMLTGPSHVFDLANAAYMQLIGHRDVLGKPVREALPDIEGQGFFELLDEVYSTGKPFIGRSLRVGVQREPGAEPEQRFVDVIYQPVRGPMGEIVGIFAEGADVTERVIAEQGIREREAQLRTLAEAMPNLVWAAQRDGALDWLSAQVYQYSGARPGELDGKGWASVIHPDDMPATSAKWAEALASGEQFETEFRLRRHDGAYRWHLARAVPIRDAEGKVTRWIGTNTDIHDQKQTAYELAASEARLHLAIEAGQLAVWEVDIATGDITVSAALNRLHGFPEDARPTQEQYRSRYAPGEMARLDQLGAAAQARGATELEAELRQLWPDGTEKWLLMRAQAAEEGKKAIGVLIDITDRKQVEQQLVESERRFRLSQNAAGIASLELDVPTGTVRGSDNFWGLWGLERRDSIHISELENIVIPEDGHVRSTPETRANGRAAPNVEYRIRRADTGELRWLSRHIEFTYDELGRPQKMFGVIQDITEAKDAQTRQQVLTHELEHRIKNILAMVSAITSQTLRNADPSTARAVLDQRLRALSNAHDILTRTRWTTASLSDVVSSTLAPLPAERISLAGPDVALTPKMALSLALAVNELATNSLKYGALSIDSGRVEVSWTLDRDPAGTPLLRWTWNESGGPAVSPPTRKGFGRFLIERVLATDFGGQVSLDYDTGGVSCTLIAPMPGAANTSEDASR